MPPKVFKLYNEGMEFNQSSHALYYTQYHLVFCTKYRLKTLAPGFAHYTSKVLLNIAQRLQGVEIKEINVRPDHVHLVMIIPPKYSVAKVLEILKSRSAKIVRKKFAWLDNPYYGTDSLWSPGYCASTVGLNAKAIRRYVKYQQNQDNGQAKLKLE